MIPKVIHYCWFGGNPLDELAEKCIASWKKFCPDYAMIQWNETNYDVTKNEYMRLAYEAKKWAFVSDYARLDIVYEHGGIYLDTDVELIKPLDPFCKNKAFMGLDFNRGVNTGLGFGAIAKHDTIREMRDAYGQVSFLNPDGTFNLRPNISYQQEVLRGHGLLQINETQHIAGMVIYPPEVFCPLNNATGELNITSNTVAIHHYGSSWLDQDALKKAKEHREKYQKMASKYGHTFVKVYIRLQNFGSVFRSGGLTGVVRKIKDNWRNGRLI